VLYAPPQEDRRRGPVAVWRGVWRVCTRVGGALVLEVSTAGIAHHSMLASANSPPHAHMLAPKSAPGRQDAWQYGKLSVLEGTADACVR